MLERHYDEDTGIISVEATGTLTVAEVDKNCAELRQLIADLRHDGRPVRVLYDIARLPPQDDELENYICTKITQTFRDDDRCAVLTKDLATKRHFRNIVRTKQIAVTATLLPAEMWLLFDQHAH